MPTPARILIVEDDEIISNLISVMLEKQGYSVAGKASSGEGAIMKAAELEPDMILMDIGLAGQMDGITAARHIFTLFSIPVIFLTGNTDDDVLSRAKSAEPYGFILKPFNSKEVTSNIEIALYNHSVRKKYFDRFDHLDVKKIMTALEAIVITDIRGRIIFFNPYAPRVLDLSPGDILMKSFQHVVILVNKQTTERIPDPVKDVIHDMIAVTYELNTILVTRTNKKRYVGITARPIINEKKEMSGVYVIIREKTISEIKMANIKA